MIPFDTALELLDRYRTFPQEREDQIKFLRSIGYEGLKGGGKFPHPRKEQLRAVVYRVLEEAEQVVRDEVQYARDQMAMDDYWNSLYDGFNIPEDEREECGYSPADLERMMTE